VIVRKGGRVEILEDGGPIIGLGTGFPCDEGTAKLEDGERV
jgi:hypothetical protein